MECLLGGGRRHECLLPWCNWGCLQDVNILDGAARPLIGQLQTTTTSLPYCDLSDYGAVVIEYKVVVKALSGMSLRWWQTVGTSLAHCVLAGLVCVLRISCVCSSVVRRGVHHVVHADELEDNIKRLIDYENQGMF